VRATPLCSVSYCPRPSDPDFHICWCGTQATEHHHVEPRGMGGSEAREFDKNNVVSLCHFHHEMVTKHTWTDEVDAGVYKVKGMHGGVIGQKSLIPQDFSDTTIEDVVIGDLQRLVESLILWPDDALAAYSRKQHMDATQCYIRHCAAVYAYREKYKSYGDAWSEQAHPLFGYAARTLRRDALFCVRLLEWSVTATPEEIELVSEITDRQLKLVAQSKDFSMALEVAIDYRAETGNVEPRGLAGRLQSQGVLDRPNYSYQCPACGHTDALSEFRRGE